MVAIAISSMGVTADALGATREAPTLAVASDLEVGAIVHAHTTDRHACRVYTRSEIAVVGAQATRVAEALKLQSALLIVVKSATIRP